MSEVKLIRGSDWGGSRLATAQTCKRKYFNRYERPNKDEGLGIIRLEDSYAASKGTLLHTFFQVYYKQRIEKPDEDKRTQGLVGIKAMLDQVASFTIPEERKPLLIDEIVAAADQYLVFYADDTLVPLAVEEPITVRIPDLDGQIHVHTGIVDLFAMYLGAPFVVDHKTTSQSFANLFNQYTNSLSFKGYCKGAIEARGEQVGVLVNGLRFRGTKKLECEFQREQYLYTPNDLEEFDKTVVSIKREIQMCRDESFWPKAGDQCVKPWGLCEYFPLCKFDDPAMEHALYKPVPRKGE